MDSYLGFKAQGFGFDAHLTVLYIGEQTPEYAEYIRAYLKENYNATRRMYVLREGAIALFGPENTIPVVRVTVDNDLRNLRSSLETKFENASQFKDWNPHITLDFDVAIPITIPYMIELTDFGLY